MGKKVEALKHHADVAADGIDILDVSVEIHPVYDDVAVLVRFQSIDAANQGRFPGPGRTADDNALALAHAQIDVLQDMKLSVPLVDVLEGDHDLLGNRRCNVFLAAGKYDFLTHWGTCYAGSYRVVFSFRSRA